MIKKIPEQFQLTVWRLWRKWDVPHVVKGLSTVEQGGLPGLAVWFGAVPTTEQSKLCCHLVVGGGENV